MGRRFNQEWIFRGLDYTFTRDKSYAILGPNGSGKSTLIKVLTGQLAPSEGKISYFIDDKEIDIDKVFEYVSIAAPYIELIEDFTLTELIDFHFQFKRYLPGFNAQRLIEILKMEKSAHKGVKHFSSGMKQRVKLILACATDSSLLFLDEPTSNLDVAGEEWYLELLELTKLANRLIIIGSNQEKEYNFCDERLSIMNYK